MRKFYAFNPTAIANEAAITKEITKLHQQYPTIVDDVATMTSMHHFNPIRSLNVYTGIANIIPFASYDEDSKHFTILQHLGSNITNLDNLEKYLLDFDVTIYDNYHVNALSYAELEDIIDNANTIDITTPVVDDFYQTFADSDTIVAAQPSLVTLQQSSDTMVHQYLFNTKDSIAAAKALKQAVIALPNASWPTNRYLANNILGDCIHSYHRTILVMAKYYNPVFFVHNIKDIDTYFAAFKDDNTVITDASLACKAIDSKQLDQQVLANSLDKYNDNGQVIAKHVLTLPAVLTANKLTGRFQFKDTAKHHTYTLDVISAQPVVTDENGIVLNS